MSEKYPAAWRAACLELLQVRKNELHSLTGYKKMSWEPICKEILASLTEFWGKKSFYDDQRISRQNLDSWEKGKELKDDKFALIDFYVRSLALSGKDSRAIKVMREWRFQQAASVFSTLYMRSSGTKALPDGIIGDTPWTLISGQVEGTWFRSVVVRATSSLAGVANLVVAYLPVAVDRLEKNHFNEVVFLEGFLLPLEIRDVVTGAGEPADSTVCSLKLVRPEFRGLSGIGYAEGEMHIQTTRFRSISGNVRKIYSLEFPSSVLCPVVSDEWNGQSRSVEISKVYKRNFGSGDDVVTRTRNIRLSIDPRKNRIIDKLFDLSYRGYVQ